MFVVVAGSLRVLLPCVRVGGAFVCAYLMLTLTWTVGSHFFSLMIIFLPSFFELFFFLFLFVSAVRVPRVCVCQKFDRT